ncbi:hypothetical protein [Pseudooceanicola sp. HF7]|uniref:hypothetical protein n=1 Tax=Pseudooceanicola sp. HF7 TaxID=2721560 RepID=UPI0020CA5D1F|nr:hypothetical protein [Pseudooceanicola sp. HF7]
MPTAKPTKDYTIAALWMQGPLSFLEQLCLKSFLDAGHRNVVLYHYGELQNVPDGIQLADANEILPQENFLKHERTGSPALHSDLFRYHMLAKSRDTIWADTDAYCVRQFDTPNGHFYGWESPHHVNGGVLGLPHDSDTLAALLDWTTDEYAIPPYYGPDYEAELTAKRDAGTPVHAGEQPWGVWGPHLVTHCLQQTGEIRHALPQEALYPIGFKQRRLMMRPGVDTSGYITENTYSIHLYGRRVREFISDRYDGIPHPDSLIGKLLTQHDIDPTLAPIRSRKDRDAAKKETPVAAPAETPAHPVTPPLPAAEKAGRGQVNLTDLADAYGSDKGSVKHRYTELYQMLFLPYRNRSIDFLEMGLQIGGPEHGKSPDRTTTDAPSIRMWLEYFTKARINGLDVSDFSWFEDPRFTFHRCDMGDRAKLAEVAADLPALDIAIDDASHASHHQQNAFLELFPKVKSGGLYIIEDLRWQPDEMEIPGITKTAAMFQAYAETGAFAHVDPKVAEEFNAQRIDISGSFVFQAKFQKRRKDQVVVIHKR